MASAIATFAGQLGRLVPRVPSGGRSFGYVAWTVGWFLLFLLLTFPHDLVVRHWTDQVAAESGWQIRYDDVWFRPWNGYHLAKARLIAPGKDTEAWIAASEIVFRPSFLRRGGYPFRFSGRAYGGDLTISLDESRTLDLSWNGLQLAQYPRLASVLEGDWNGELSGELRVIVRSDVKNLEGRGKLGLRNASLTQAKAQGLTIPDLHFSSGEAELEIKAARVEVRSLKLSGSEVDAELHGQLYLPGTNAMPIANAALSVKPLPGAPAGFEPLLTALNHDHKPPSGSYSFTVYGPLNGLRVR